MGKDSEEILLPFLQALDADKRALVLWLREFAWKVCPGANELIYDNYNAIAIGWSLTDKVSHNICTIAIYRTNQNIHFGFYWGNLIKDPDGLFLGEGKQYRYVLVKDRASFPKTYLKARIHEAEVVAMSKVKDGRQIKHGLTILKSIAPSKRK